MTRAKMTALVLVAALLHCATPATGPSRYRLSDSGESWRGAGDDPVLDDLAPRYPEFFRIILDPAKTQEPDIRRVRDDLEREDSGRERFDALNAVAIAYFELNGRAQRGLETEDGGDTYLPDSFRATKLLSIPWRAYRDIEDPALRGAILDFYEDIAAGNKAYARETAPRILPLVESLEKKETDPARLERIRALSAMLQSLQDARELGAI